MCCLRKSPFHRKNITKLIQHPFVQNTVLKKLEKSFDDVSELYFEERPRSQKSSKHLIAPVKSNKISRNINAKPIKNTAFAYDSEYNHNDNLSKKINKNDKQEHIETKYFNQLASEKNTNNQQTKYQQLENKNGRNMKGLKLDFLQINEFNSNDNLLDKEIQFDNYEQKQKNKNKLTHLINNRLHEVDNTKDFRINYNRNTNIVQF